MLIPKGTNVTCPKCGSVQVRAAMHLYQGMLTTVDLFEEVNFHLVNGARMQCRTCKIPWFADGSFHTEKGWVPPRPHLTYPDTIKSG